MSVTHLKLFPRQTDLPFAQQAGQQNIIATAAEKYKGDHHGHTNNFQTPSPCCCIGKCSFFPPFHHPPAALIPLRFPVSLIGPSRVIVDRRALTGSIMALPAPLVTLPRRAAPLGISRSRRITRHGIPVVGVQAIARTSTSGARRASSR